MDKKKLDVWHKFDTKLRKRETVKRPGIFSLSWGARGRWFESSRPDHYFSNQNAQIDHKARGAKAYCELLIYTEFYRDLPVSLTQKWHKFLRASETVSEPTRTVVTKQFRKRSAGRQYVYRIVGGAA